ncbi:MAG: helix-turn-helix domain-containing protein [bacterium]
MAREKDKQKALVMRQKGMSYSQIKEKLGISKSTLSGWLYNMPLSEKRIRELQADSPIRIEKYRNTMRAKREKKFDEAYKEMSRKIKKLSSRELFLAGLFLYWAEGSKTAKAAIGLTNTNPNMLKFYIKWLELIGVKRDQFRVHLHLYSDMDIKKSEKYWSKELSIPLKHFRKSYIKKTKLSSITYHNGFGRGTCSVLVGGARLYEKVMMGLKYIQDDLIE